MTDVPRSQTENTGAKKSARRRRFSRTQAVSDGAMQPAHFEVRRRDLEMIATVARLRFANTEQVCRLFVCDCPRVDKIGVRAGQPAIVRVKQHRENCACSCGVQHRKREHAPECPALFKDEQHVGSRLRELFQAGFLERPVTQLQLRVKDGVVAEGSVPMVYCVSSAGLALIGAERREALGAGKMSWVNKTNEGTRVFMEHTLAVADVSIGVDVAVRQRQNLERLSEAALCAGMWDERRASARPFALKARYKGEELTAVCDLAFAIGDTVRRKRWNFLVEVDLGTMPVERSDLARSSIMRKLVAYAKAYDDNQHESEFGWKGFRLLILTTSQTRMLSCVKAARERFGTASVARLFVFGTLEASRDMLGRSFVDVDGKPVQLIDV